MLVHGIGEKMWSEEGLFLGWSFLFFYKRSGLIERWTVKFRYTNDLIADWSLFWFGYERVL